MFNVVIGYDRRARIPAYVAAESIMGNTSTPVKFTFLHRNTLGDLVKPVQPNDSTEFSTSRFLTPYLSGYTGWSLFLDNDVLVRGDIAEIFSLADDRYTVMCVKHSYEPKEDTKFLGHTQLKYKFKNWSSVLLFNNSRCRQLTPEYIRAVSGLDLHQFKWIDDHSRIGSLPPQWNYLAGYSGATDPKLVHYTDGGPWYSSTSNCEYSPEWFDLYRTVVKIDI